ncbi:MAG: hypothetical protein RIA69_12770 [Cyclobacteriaceae bacterium]
MESTIEYIGLFKFIFGTIGFLAGIVIFSMGIIKKNIKWRNRGAWIIINTLAFLLLVLGIQRVID